MTQVDNVSEENSRERNSRQFLLLLIFFQTIFIILFGFFVKYDENWNDDELTRNRLKMAKDTDIMHITNAIPNYKYSRMFL